MAGRIENLNAMIISVGNDILPYFVDSNTSQAVEFAFAIAIAAKTEPVLTMFVEHLNAMIGRIGDNYRVVRSNGDTTWPSEQAWLTTSRSKGHQETLFVVRIVDLVVDLIIPALVGIFVL